MNWTQKLIALMLNVIMIALIMIITHTHTKNIYIYMKETSSVHLFLFVNLHVWFCLAIQQPLPALFLIFIYILQNLWHWFLVNFILFFFFFWCVMLKIYSNSSNRSTIYMKSLNMWLLILTFLRFERQVLCQCASWWCSVCVNFVGGKIYNKYNEVCVFVVE